MKLLIADDEPHVREYMKTVLNWEERGIHLCGCAEDGEEALEMAIKENPDMALLDINMPGLDGLKLTETLKERFPDMVLGFITGYSEFEYARRALQLGAEEYILKPFSPEELDAAVCRLKMKIQNRARERHASVEESRILRDNFFWQILTGAGILTDDQLKEKLDRRRIQVPYETFLVVQLDIGFENQEQEKELNLWKFSVRNVMEEYSLMPQTVQYVLEGDEKKIILVLNGNREILEKERLTAHFTKVQKILRDYLKLLITVGIGDTKMDIKEIHDSYCESEVACQEQTSGGRGNIYFYGELTEKRKNSVHRFSKSIASKRAEEIIAAVEKAVQEQYQDYTLSVEKIAESVYLDASYIRRIFSKYMGCTIVDYLTEYRMKEARRLLETGNISVARVAENVGYTDPGYFTKCFKKYYGVTPSNYPVFSQS